MDLFFGIFYYLAVLGGVVAVVVAAGSVVTFPVYMLMKAMRKQVSKYAVFAIVDIVLGLALGICIFTDSGSESSLASALTSAVYLYWCLPAFVISFIAAVIKDSKSKFFNETDDEADSFQEDAANEEKLNNLINRLENKEEK